MVMLNMRYDREWRDYEIMFVFVCIYLGGTHLVEGILWDMMVVGVVENDDVRMT